MILKDEELGMLKSTSPKVMSSKIAATAMVVALALTGCQSAVDQQQQATSSPVKGGTLSIAQSADAIPGSVLSSKLGNSSWAANVFETLFVYDQDMKPQPLLATEWKLSDDGLTMDISLRDDVRFHSGRTMTAEDVKFSLESSAKQESGAQVGFIARSFKGIEVISPTTLKIQFSQPTPNVFDLFEQTYIVDKDTYAKLADGSQVIGTGPFLFKSWTPGSAVQLVRNENYWGEPALLDGIDIAVITDSTAQLNAVRSNRSNVAIGMSPVDIQTFDSNPAFQIAESSGSVLPIGFDVKTAPFDKKEVRQAISYAIDRERIAKQVFGGSGVVTDLFWDPATPGYPEDLAKKYTYDPEKAKQMLADAGAAGAEFPITVISLPQNTSMAEIIRNNLEVVGLKPRINVTEVSSFASRQVEANLGVVFLPLHGLNGFGPVSLINTLPALRKENPSHFFTPEYDQLRKNLVNAKNDQESEEALRKLSEYILDEAFSVPVVQQVGQTVVANSVQGVRLSSRGYIDAKSTYIAK